MMSGVRGRDTKLELMLRQALHARGLRYRTNIKNLPGKPDVVFPRWKVALFVHGCFWHRHPGCRYATMPATRPESWRAKFDANVARDEANKIDLNKLGWRVGVVWGCAIGKSPPTVLIDQIVEFVRGDGLREAEWP